jgi:hypothetical protein
LSGVSQSKSRIFDFTIKKISVEMPSLNFQARVEDISTTARPILLESSAKWPPWAVFSDLISLTFDFARHTCQNAHIVTILRLDWRWQLRAQSFSDLNTGYIFGTGEQFCIWSFGRVVKALALGPIRRNRSRETV